MRGFSATEHKWKGVKAETGLFVSLWSDMDYKNPNEREDLIQNIHHDLNKMKLVLVCHIAHFAFNNNHSLIPRFDTNMYIFNEE
jgi:hypothetical protein